MPDWRKIWKALTTPVGAPQEKEKDTVEDDLCDFRSQWLTVHIALAEMRMFEECSSYHPVPQSAEKLRKTVEELKRLSMRSDYPQIVRKGASEFAKNWKTKISPDERRRVEQPDRIDVDAMVRQKFCELASSYRLYWEGALAQLVRKSAIVKRRHYLVDDIDKFIGTLPEKYPGVVEELEKYMAFNLEKIESLG